MRTVVVRVREKDGPFETATVIRRGKGFVQIAEEPLQPRHLAGKSTVMLLDTKIFHFFKDQVFAGPSEVMALQIQEKVERSGLFAKVPSIFYQVEDQEGTQIRVAVAAVDTSSMQAQLEALWSLGARVQGVVPPALAVAFLAAQCSHEKTLTVWIEEHGFYLLVTAGGRVHSIRYVAFDDLTGPSETLVLQEVDFNREQFQRLEGEGFQIVRSCGPLRHLLPQGDVPWPEEILAKPLHETAFLHPEWFGALLVPSAFNMLPESIRAWTQHLPWAMRVAVVLLALAVGQLGLYGYAAFRAQSLEKQVQAQMQAVASKAEALQKAIPWDRLARAQEYRKTLETFQKQPRLDEWIVWLSETVPKNFRIVHCRVSSGGEDVPGPHAAARSARRRGSDTEAGPTSRGWTLSLELKGTVTFQEAHRAFGSFLAALKERDDVRTGRFHYDEKTGEAVFSFEVAL